MPLSKYLSNAWLKAIGANLGLTAWVMTECVYERYQCQWVKRGSTVITS